MRVVLVGTAIDATTAWHATVAVAGITTVSTSETSGPNKKQLHHLLSWRNLVHAVVLSHEVCKLDVWGNANLAVGLTSVRNVNLRSRKNREKNTGNLRRDAQRWHATEIGIARNYELTDDVAQLPSEPLIQEGCGSICGTIISASARCCSIIMVDAVPAAAPPNGSHWII